MNNEEIEKMSNEEIDEMISWCEIFISNRKLIIQLIDNKPILPELKQKYLEQAEPEKKKYREEIKVLEKQIEVLKQHKKGVTNAGQQ